MSRREKLLAKVRNNPKAVRFEELTTLLEWHGFELKRIRGSHHIYSREHRIINVTRRVPHVSQGAVKEVLGMIDEILEEEE